MKAVILSESADLVAWLLPFLKENGVDPVTVRTNLCQIDDALLGDKAFLVFWHDRFELPFSQIEERLTHAHASWEWLVLTDKADDQLLLQAIRMHAFGVISPRDAAETIQATLEDCIHSLNQRRKAQLIQDAFRQQRYALVGQCMRGLLTYARNELDLEYMEKLGMVPCMNKLTWMALLHVTNRKDNAQTPRTVLSMYTSMKAEKLFDALNEMQAMAWMQNDVFVLFLQSRSGIEPSWPMIQSSLDRLRLQVEEEYGWKMNMYAAGPLPLRDCPGKWTDLERCMKDNIVMRSGVYHINDLKSESLITQRLQMNDLWRLLNQGQLSIVENELLLILQHMQSNEQQGHTALHHFYHQFMQIVYSVMWEKGWNAEDLFQSEEEMELRQNSVKNLSSMAELIRFVIAFFRTRNRDGAAESSVQAICRYIHDHMQEPLLREELAAYVHLNPDYLSRIFRRAMNMSIKDYIIKTRMEAAHRLLRGTRMRISHIAEAVGYENFSYFTQIYRQVYGITPLQDRNGSSLNEHP